MYVFSVLLDGFYAASLSPESGPLAVHRDGKILDSCEEARRRKVLPGMALSEARSILAIDGRVVAWAEETYVAAQRRWLEIVAEFSDSVEPLSQHEALADFASHPRPREAAQRLQERLTEAGFVPRCSLGRCRWVARLAARRGDPLGLAYSDARSYVADIPVSMLPIEPAHAKHLELLGYRTAGAAAKLSSETLSTQFGDASLLIGLSVLGSGDGRVERKFPEASVASRFVFDGTPETQEAFQFGLRRVASKVGSELRNGDLSGKTVEIFLEREDGSVERLSRSFARALSSRLDVLVAASLMLPDGPTSPVESVRIRLPGLKSTRRVQLDLNGGRSASDAAESVRAALEVVRNTFGDTSVRLAGEIPEPRWVKVRRAYVEANGFCWT